MADLSITASFDGTAVERGVQRMAAKVESESTRAGRGLGRFGLEGEGVLKKLARQFSLTDLAAAAVFATIAKGQQVMRDSLKAYEEQQKKIEATTGAQSAYLEAIRQSEGVIRRNNEVIGEQVSQLKLLAKSYEETASSIIATAIQFNEDPSLAKFLKLTAQYGSLFGVTTVTTTPGGRTGPPSTGFDADTIALFEEIRRQQEAEAARQAKIPRFRYGTSGEDRTRSRGGRRDTGRAGGIDSMVADYEAMLDRLGEFPPFIQAQIDAEEELIKRREEAYQQALSISTEFTEGVIGSFNDMLFRGESLMDGIKRAFFGLLEDILSEITRRQFQPITDAIASAIYGGFGGAGASPSSSRDEVELRLSPQLRELASRGRI